MINIKKYIIESNKTINKLYAILAKCVIIISMKTKHEKTKNHRDNEKKAELLRTTIFVILVEFFLKSRTKLHSHAVGQKKEPNMKPGYKNKVENKREQKP